MELKTEIALIISNGLQQTKTSIRMAHEIVEMLEKRAKREDRRPKPKRGIGAVSQVDLFRGK